MKILLTGYTGFLGRHLARALKNEGFFVTVLLHRSTVTCKDLETEVDDVIWGSIADREKIRSILEEAEAVVHSAWNFSSPNAGRPTPNEIGTRILFEESVRAGIERFAFISSVAVYGMANRDDLRESDPVAAGVEAGFIYPSEKIKVEEFLRSQTPGLTKIGIFRPGIILDDTNGPMKKIFTIAGRSFAVGIGNGHNRMPYIHAKDVSSAVTRWLKNGQESDVFNVTPSNCIRQVDWHRSWCKMHGQNATPVFIPPSIVRFGTYGVKLLKKLLGKQSQGNVDYVVKSATRDTSYSNEKLKRELGWKDESTKAITNFFS